MDKNKEDLIKLLNLVEETISKLWTPDNKINAEKRAALFEIKGQILDLYTKIK